MWGIQAENQPIATSYIKTQASTVTLAAEYLSINSRGNVPDAGRDLSILIGALIPANGLNVGNTQEIFDVKTNVGETMSLYVNSADETRVRAYSTGAGVFIENNTQTFSKIAVTYDIASSRIKVYLDGLQISDLAYVQNVVQDTVADILRIGERTQGAAAPCIQLYIRNLIITDYVMDAVAVQLAHQG